MSQDQRLQDRVAIVTGAGARTGEIGNGRASSILLARNGAKVALIDHDLASAEETAEMITREGGTCMALQADVTNPEACEKAVSLVAERWGRVDILVNNVGILGAKGTAVDVDLEEWDYGLRINLTSMVLMAKHAIPHMNSDGRGGAIVNMSSIGGMQGAYEHLLYPTSKGAIINLTRAMAAQHGASQIRVNCIAPGTIYTPFAGGKNMTPEMRKARANRSMLKTEGTGWDIGQAVLFLVSDEARWITGVLLPVDGGATAGGLPPAASAPR